MSTCQEVVSANTLHNKTFCVRGNCADLTALTALRGDGEQIHHETLPEAQ